MHLAPPETATTVRVQDGKTLTTDGPFVEIKESSGGYLHFEADDLDAAIELASRIELSEADFVRLAKAFFAEIKRRYP